MGIDNSNSSSYPSSSSLGGNNSPSSSADGVSSVYASASAVAVDGNDDLLTEILQRLPAKPVTQFKSVSKRWLSLISDKRFSLFHARRDVPAVSALLLCSFHTEQDFALIPFDNFTLGAQHFQFLTNSGTTILHSCNGFFCYSKLKDKIDRPILEYYVCNATTKRSVRIPLLGLVYFSRRHKGIYKVLHKLCKVKIEEFVPENEPTVHLLGMYVAFDPKQSPHYSVICVWEWNAFVLNYEIKITVYRSETGSWGETLGSFRVPYEVSFNTGVSWNGRLHWISSTHMVCFDIDGGEVTVISLPLISKDSKPIYFGVSRGHLSIVVNKSGTDVLLTVFEIKRDYSLWIMKFRFDIEPVLVIPWETVSNYMPRAFSLIYLDTGEKEEEPYVVLGVYGKVIFYNLDRKISKKLCDFPSFCYYNRMGWAPCGRYRMFPFHETLLEL